MVKGTVTVGAVDKISIPNVSFLMGNDLAGDLVIVVLLTSLCCIIVQLRLEIEQSDFPLLYSNKIQS